MEFVQVTQAKEKHAAGAARLYVDGRQVFSAEMHQQKMAELDTVLENDMAALVEKTGRELAEAQAELQKMDLPRDPVGLLTGDDLARAGQLRPFVNEDVETLGADDLAGRVRGILADGDRVQAALWLRGIRRRVAAEVEGKGEKTRGLLTLAADLENFLQDPATVKRRAALRSDIEHLSLLRGAAATARPSSKRATDRVRL